MCNIFTDSILNDVKIVNIDFNLCTHLIVLDRSFQRGKGIASTILKYFLKFIIFCALDPWDWTDSYREKDYKQITSLRKIFPHLNVRIINCLSCNKIYLIKWISGVFVH